MRLLLDTCIFIYMATEPENLSREVDSLLNDYDNQLYISMKSVEELIVAYRHKGLWRKKWKTADDIINSIKEEFYITILPIHEEHIHTYARLQINEAQGHHDPSDHIIIAHAITEKMTLISSDRKFEFYRGQGLDFVWNKR